mgnify:CR=1 FL=1|jgi:DNA invertase Pin-like site-specific DNA recombinase
MGSRSAGIAQFERDLISERVKSGLAAARARGKNLVVSRGNDPNLTGLRRKSLLLSGKGAATAGSRVTWGSAKTQSSISSNGIVKMLRVSFRPPANDPNKARFNHYSAAYDRMLGQ